MKEKNCQRQEKGRPDTQDTCSGEEKEAPGAFEERRDFSSSQGGGEKKKENIISRSVGEKAMWNGRLRIFGKPCFEKT